MVAVSLSDVAGYVSEAAAAGVTEVAADAAGAVHGAAGRKQTRSCGRIQVESAGDCEAAVDCEGVDCSQRLAVLLQ